jgi:hypothetical protein
MPLRRAAYHEPIVDKFHIRFPMLDDGDNLVWGEVSDYALRQRASLDGIESSLEKAALFERYRSLIEKRASEFHDQGKTFVAPAGTRFVQVPTGTL